MNRGLGCFGWALEKAVSKEDDDGNSLTKIISGHHACTHHHQNKTNLVGKPQKSAAVEAGDGSNDQQWIWWPSWHDFTTRYMRSIGFVANFILFWSATVFWIIGFAGLPGIFDKLSSGATYGVFWTPDIVGSVGFVVSS